LPPGKLEQRDKYFTRLRATIEEMYNLNNKRKVVLLAHSLGMEWNDDGLYRHVWLGQLFLGSGSV